MRHTARSKTGAGLNQYSLQLRAAVSWNHHVRKRVMRYLPPSAQGRLIFRVFTAWTVELDEAGGCQDDRSVLDLQVDRGLAGGFDAPREHVDEAARGLLVRAQLLTELAAVPRL